MSGKDDDLIAQKNRAAIVSMIRRELQDEIMLFSNSNAKTGKPVTADEIKALLMRKMLELEKRQLIAVPVGEKEKDCNHFWAGLGGGYDRCSWCGERKESATTKTRIINPW